MTTVQTSLQWPSHCLMTSYVYLLYFLHSGEEIYTNLRVEIKNLIYFIRGGGDVKTSICLADGKSVGKVNKKRKKEA